MWQKIDNWFKDKTGQDIVLIAIILIFPAGMVPLAATAGGIVTHCFRLRANRESDCRFGTFYSGLRPSPR